MFLDLVGSPAFVYPSSLVSVGVVNAEMATQNTYVYEDASDTRRFIAQAALSFTGTWLSGSVYGAFDVSDYQSNQWVSLTSNVGQTPPANVAIRDTYWSQLVLYDERSFSQGSVSVTADGLGTPL